MRSRLLLFAQNYLFLLKYDHIRTEFGAKRLGGGGYLVLNGYPPW